MSFILKTLKNKLVH